ncbi:MAG: hypothetical protein WD696_04895 [Bryobacteraceae bacterium]
MLFVAVLTVLTIFTPLWIERRRVPERSILGGLEREFGRRARAVIQLMQLLVLALVIIVVLKFFFALKLLTGL